MFSGGIYSFGHRRIAVIRRLGQYGGIRWAKEKSVSYVSEPKKWNCCYQGWHLLQFSVSGEQQSMNAVRYTGNVNVSVFKGWSHFRWKQRKCAETFRWNYNGLPCAARFKGNARQRHTTTAECWVIWVMPTQFPLVTKCSWNNFLFSYRMLPEYQGKISICNYRFIKQFTQGYESDWTINVANHFKPIDFVNE